MSRDGQRIVYVEGLVTSNIHKVGFDPATEKLHDHVPVTEGSRLVAFYGGPTVSPDGQWIAYSASEGHEDMFVMRADGSGVVQLTDDEFRSTTTGKLCTWDLSHTFSCRKSPSVPEWRIMRHQPTPAKWQTFRISRVLASLSDPT